MQTAVGWYWDKSKLSSSRLACRPRIFHCIKTDMIKTRIGGYSASDRPRPPHPVPHTESTSQSGHLCVEGTVYFWFAVLFWRWRGRWGLRVPWPSLLVEGIGAFAPLLLLGGEGEVVFLCFLALFWLLWVCVVWLFVLSGTGVSASSGQGGDWCCLFLTLLSCGGGKNDWSCCSFGWGIRRLLRKDSLSGVGERNTSKYSCVEVNVGRINENEVVRDNKWVKITIKTAKYQKKVILINSRLILSCVISLFFWYL